MDASNRPNSLTGSFDISGSSAARVAFPPRQERKPTFIQRILDYRAANPYQKTAMVAFNGAFQDYLSEKPSKSLPDVMERLYSCAIGTKEALVGWIFISAVHKPVGLLPTDRPIDRIAADYQALFLRCSTERTELFATEFFKQGFDFKHVVGHLTEIYPHTHFAPQHYAFLFKHKSVSDVFNLIIKMQTCSHHLEQKAFNQGILELAREQSGYTPSFFLERIYGLYPNNPDLYLKAVRGIPFTDEECIQALEAFSRHSDAMMTEIWGKVHLIVVSKIFRSVVMDFKHIFRILMFLIPKDPVYVLRWLAENNLKDEPLATAILRRCSVTQLAQLLSEENPYQQNPSVLDQFIKNGGDLTKLPNWETLFLEKIIPMVQNLTKGQLKPAELSMFLWWLQKLPDNSSLPCLLKLIRFADFPIFWTSFRLPQNPSEHKESIQDFLESVANVWPELHLCNAQKRDYPQTYMPLQDTLDHIMYWHHFPERINLPQIPLSDINGGYTNDPTVYSNRLLAVSLARASLAEQVRAFIDPFLEWVAVEPQDIMDERNEHIERINTCLHVLGILSQAMNKNVKANLELFEKLIKRTHEALLFTEEGFFALRYLMQLALLSKSAPHFVSGLSLDIQSIVDLAYQAATTPELKVDLQRSMTQLLNTKPNWFLMKDSPKRQDREERGRSEPKKARTPKDK